MILSGIINLILGLLYLVFGWIDLIDMPVAITSIVDWGLDFIFSNLGFLNLFFRVSTLQTIIPIFLIVFNFDKLYHFTMFILRKFPNSID